MTEQHPADKLFSPVRIGEIECANRIFMAPLTRCRALPGSDAPHALNAEYYRQRASAGLIVSEATQVQATGKGYMGTPGIYSPEQEAGWALVTSAVHKAGGKIIAQLWHVGAISHPDMQPGGALPVTASDGFNPGGVTHTQNGKVERVGARAMTIAEIEECIAAYRHACEVAKRAGFDGVEIHGANGYLLEQFIRDSSNSRTDEYGGSIDNRLRFVLATVDAAISVFGAGRVGIRVSPTTAANNAKPDSNPQATYGTFVEELARRKIAFVHFIEGNTGVAHDKQGFDYAAARRTLKATGVATIVNNKYNRAMAIETLARDEADAVAFGVAFISNPDLVERLRRNANVNPANTRTYYGPDGVGYTDYPTLAQEAQRAA